MDRTELRQMVAQMLREMGTEIPVRAADPTEICHEIPDITQEDLREQYLVKNPMDKDAFMELKRKTPARLGIGRAGARYRTTTFLRFRAYQAAAQDSVFSPVEEDFWKKHGYHFVKTMCKDKDEYLTRPDLGRKFAPEEQDMIRKVCGESPRVLLVIGDGLSSAAVEKNAPDCAAAIRQGLSSMGLTLGETLFIQYCRVGASDHIGTLTDAEVVCMLVGERPGLVTNESMSAYITYKPYVGIPESKRTVVSNIHRQGTPAVEAGAHIASVIKTILEKKVSGVELGKAMA